MKPLNQNNMKEEFVNYNQSLALKELGFDEPCFGFHSKIHGLMMFKTSGSSSLYKDAGECLAPLYQQVFRWFREKHDLSGIPTDESYEIWRLNDGVRECIIEEYPLNNFEEAESDCINKLIEIVKNKKDEKDNTDNNNSNSRLHL